MSSFNLFTKMLKLSVSVLYAVSYQLNRIPNNSSCLLLYPESMSVVACHMFSDSLANILLSWCFPLLSHTVYRFIQHEMIFTAS